MKTDKQQVASSASILPSTTTKNEIAPGGAVVSFSFVEEKMIKLEFVQVPEENNQNGLVTNDDIENRTKIMMRFMDDLTNIYFSTRNSLRLTVENGFNKRKLFFF
jgi:hypothetical protein